LGGARRSCQAADRPATRGSAARAEPGAFRFNISIDSVIIEIALTAEKKKRRHAARASSGSPARSGPATLSAVTRGAGRG